jgi:hypothetical protein
MLSEGSSVKIRHWIIAGSVPLYIGRMASFARGVHPVIGRARNRRLKRQRPHIVRPLRTPVKT